MVSHPMPMGNFVQRFFEYRNNRSYYEQGPDLYAFIGFIGFIGPGVIHYMC